MSDRLQSQLPSEIGARPLSLEILSYEGAQDHTPESFRTLNRPYVRPQPWGMTLIPDLLQAPTSTNTTIGDDSPESFSLANTVQPPRPNGSTAYSQLPIQTQASHLPALIGGAPRDRRSLGTLDSRESGTSLGVSPPLKSSISRLGSSSAVDLSVNPSPLVASRAAPPLPIHSSSTNPFSSRPVSDSFIANRRGPITTLNLSSALQSSQPLVPPVSSVPSLSSIYSVLSQLQLSVDALTQQVNIKLDSLESRLNDLANSTSFTRSQSSTESNPLE